MVERLFKRSESSIECTAAPYGIRANEQAGQLRALLEDVCEPSVAMRLDP